MIDVARRSIERLRAVHPAGWLAAVGGCLFAIEFGRLGVMSHHNFGTWSYDTALYDQAFWQLAHGRSFVSLRGLDIWAQHLNLIGFLFVPFYWLGAGPGFLCVVQAIFLGLGAVPVYLIARDRFDRPWMGLVFSIAYLLYTPLQWLNWTMFHPESLAITPLLFAWWFAVRERWLGFVLVILFALALSEDVALIVAALGLVLAVVKRAMPDQRRYRQVSIGTVAVGVIWYLVATKLVIPHFNDGEAPAHLAYFFGHYGDSAEEIATTVLRRPDRVVSDAVQHDRLAYYKQMSWPVGWLYLFNPLGIVIALPQLFANVISLSPYARMVRYQYSALLIAPLFISTIYGAAVLWRFRAVRALVPAWLLLCAWTSNVAWSPSMLGSAENRSVWSEPTRRHESMLAALTLIPDGVSVSATYQLGPHLAQREELYDWPNPFRPRAWGDGTCDDVPDPATVQYLALDRSQIAEEDQQLLQRMLATGGPFEEVWSDDNVVVARRVGTTPAVDVLPQQAACRDLGG